jgi:hypothetical protein
LNAKRGLWNEVVAPQATYELTSLFTRDKLLGLLGILNLNLRKLISIPFLIYPGHFLVCDSSAGRNFVEGMSQASMVHGFDWSDEGELSDLVQVKD